MLLAAYGFALSALAFTWRRLMFRTTFIAVTGSLGKSTSTRAIAAVLSLRFATNVTPEGHNSRIWLARSILQTRLRHRFSLIEVGTKRPGALRRAAWQVRPDIAVVLNVARCHTDQFPTLEDMASEKAALLSRLGSKGLAVLNGDDPRVRAMAAGCLGRVVMFGRSPEFAVWASDIAAEWPSRLSFVAHAGNRTCRVQTQLVGEHWVTGALASLAVALACGMDLASAASALHAFEPFIARMQPLPLPSGATILRDDFIPSMDACLAALQVMKTARTRRRLLAMSEVTDSVESLEQAWQTLARAVATSVEFALFYGPLSQMAARAAINAGMDPASVRGFPAWAEAAEFLRSELRDGDLLLLRASATDHGERIYWAQFGRVGCAKKECAYIHLCDACPELAPDLTRIAHLPPDQRPVWRPQRR